MRMATTKFNQTDLLDGLYELSDTVWIISLDDGQISVLKDMMTPAREGQVSDYEKLYTIYFNE